MTKNNAVKQGVLLANVGSPDAPTPVALRSYLREFLGDKRVIHLTRWFWFPILYLFILPKRPEQSAALYKTIWTDQGSPLINTVKEQAEGIRERLKKLGHDDIMVEIGMGYGKPGIKSGLDKLLAAGCENITYLPLFPQYSRTTTASVHDGLSHGLKNCATNVTGTFIKRYHKNPSYRKALAENINKAMAALPDNTYLIVSYHGIPLSYTEAGDPYIGECEASFKDLVQDMGINQDKCCIGFQSRFGSEPWQEPYLDALLIKLVGEGKKNIAVACPGFSADCLETLSEIDIEYREVFEKAGGENFTYIPSLNAEPAHIDALTDVLLDAMQQ